MALFDSLTAPRGTRAMFDDALGWDALARKVEAFTARACAAPGAAGVAR
jgi:hypothetical protein